MRTVWLVLSLALCGVLVTSALPPLSIRGVRPDLFLILALAAAMTGRKDRAVTAAWITGLAKDIFSQGPLGAHAVLFLLMALVIVYIRPHFSVELPSVQALLAGFACMACNALYFLAMFVYYPHVGVVGPVGHIVLASVMTACVMPLVMFLKEGWMRFLHIASSPAISRH